EKGGIRLYRNGFRVLPYGEIYDDWLLLDSSVRRRIILVPHGNNNFFGFIEITDPDSLKFEETSSREGLLENNALEELKNFAHRIIISGVLRISEIRGRKPTSSQKEWKKEEKPTEIIKKAAEKLDEIASIYDEEISKTESTKARAVKQAQQFVLKEISKELDETADEIQTELEEKPMLRVLASLGLVIGEFTHEIKPLLSSLNISLNQITGHLSNSLKGQKIIQ
ncbi:MAG: ATP-binding protein, partial [Candidatus Hodarchaeota archaeon]